MHSSLGSPTKTHKKRFQSIQDVGCVACLIDGNFGAPCDIHHILSGGRRIGHEVTVGLCPWHHRGVPDGMSDAIAKILLGPSMAKNPREFRERYGTDTELLKLQNELIISAETMDVTTELRNIEEPL